MQMHNNERLWIKSIRVEKLFGEFDYYLSAADFPQPHKSRLMILYGDNGSGKTTIIELVFHMLSPQDNRGHKSILARTVFQSIKVVFSNNMSVIAERKSGSLLGSFEMKIKRGSRVKSNFYFVSIDGSISGDRLLPDEEIQYHKFLNDLSNINILLYYLSDYRLAQLSVDHYMYDDDRYISDVYSSNVKPNKIEDPTLIRVKYLENAMGRMVAWFRQQIISGTNVGDSNVNQIYGGIIDGILRGGSIIHGQNIVDDGLDDVVKLREALKRLENRNNEFARYGLTSAIDIKNLSKGLNRVPFETKDTITRILNTYVDSIMARLDAINDLKVMIDKMLDILSTLLTNKKVTFDIRRGMEIYSESGTRLRQNMLSSGEMQLLLLFCNTITALNRPSIFIIDEPELSLNVKWQRKLISSLLDIVGDNQVQFILATHSIELLTLYRKYVVKLKTGSN